MVFDDSWIKPRLEYLVAIGHLLIVDENDNKKYSATPIENQLITINQVRAAAQQCGELLSEITNSATLNDAMKIIAQKTHEEKVVDMIIKTISDEYNYHRQKNK